MVLKDHLAPSPTAMGRGTSQWTRFSRPYPTWLWTLAELGLPQLIWATVPVPHHLWNKKFIPHISSNLLSVLSHSLLSYLYISWWRVPLQLPGKIHSDTGWGLCYEVFTQTIPKAEQPRLSRPFVTGDSHQSSYQTCGLSLDLFQQFHVLCMLETQSDPIFNFLLHKEICIQRKIYSHVCVCLA